MGRKFVCISQKDITDCGPACLASVFRYYGLNIPTTRIRQLACTDKNGTNILGMIQAAEKSGFSAKGVRGNWEALREIPLPAIAHVVVDNRLLHYVVIIKINGDFVTAADPAQGVIKYHLEDFQQIWDGVLILLQPNGVLDTRKNDAEGSNFKRILGVLQPERKTFFMGFIAALMYTLLSLLTALFVQKIIDVILPGSDRRTLNALGIGMLIVVMLRIIFNGFRQMLLVHVSQRIDVKLILGYYKHILKLPQAFFDTRHIGDVISRVNDAVKIRYAISSVGLILLVDALIVLLSTAVILLYSINLSFIPVSFLLLNVALVWVMRKPIRKTQTSLMVNGAELQSQFVSSVDGVATIRSLMAGEYNNLKTESIFSKILRLVYKSNQQLMIIQSFADAAGSVAVIGMLWYGGTLVIENHMTAGELLSVYTLIGYLIAPIGRLLGVQQTIQDALVASERLFEILALETEEEIHSGGIRIQRETVHGNIVFENCMFQYGSRKNVLSEFNLSIPPGRITAITGKSGSGKSTIFKLLHKYYLVNEGRILLDGMDLARIETASLRSMIGLVLQETELFPVSVLENVAYGDMKPDMQKVNAIFSRLGIDQFIDELPFKCHTLIGEHGASLSGGQKQMLSIARALYRDPKILLLDEPANSIDSEFELFLESTLCELREKRCTIVVITHRPNAMRFADKVVFIEKGKAREVTGYNEIIRIQKTK